MYVFILDFNGFKYVGKSTFEKFRINMVLSGIGSPCLQAKRCASVTRFGFDAIIRFVVR
jgi:hypothetical protein